MIAQVEVESTQDPTAESVAETSMGGASHPGHGKSALGALLSKAKSKPARGNASVAESTAASMSQVSNLRHGGTALAALLSKANSKAAPARASNHSVAGSVSEVSHPGHGGAALDVLLAKVTAKQTTKRPSLGSTKAAKCERAKDVPRQIDFLAMDEDFDETEGLNDDDAALFDSDRDDDAMEMAESAAWGQLSSRREAGGKKKGPAPSARRKKAAVSKGPTVRDSKKRNRAEAMENDLVERPAQRPKFDDQRDDDDEKSLATASTAEYQGAAAIEKLLAQVKKP